MADDAAFIWDQPSPKRPRRPRPPDEGSTPDLSGRIPLREAERRFGVRASTLRAWARADKVDAVKDGSEQWMVTPESVAHHLSRKTPRAGSTEAPRATGPTEDGSAMLVPRDAWDRLMDQLGNLHEAGLHLAEARERAAKAETEASFLRERLAEMRSERDELKEEAIERRTETPGSRPSAWESFRRRYGWLWGKRSD